MQTKKEKTTIRRIPCVHKPLLAAAAAVLAKANQRWIDRDASLAQRQMIAHHPVDGGGSVGRPGDDRDALMAQPGPVSYTPLTLPTSYPV